MWFSDGDRYVGQWKADEKSGQATSYYANGTRYIGGYVAGKREGRRSTVYFPHGDRYVGARGVPRAAAAAAGGTA